MLVSYVSFNNIYLSKLVKNVFIAMYIIVVVRLLAGLTFFHLTFHFIT